MQKDIIKQKIKGFFNQEIKIKLNTSARYLMVGVTSSLVTVFLVGLGVWNFRAQIFGYFATEYLKSTSMVASKPLEDIKIPEEVTTNLIAGIVESKPENLDQKQENTVIDTVKQTNPAVVSIIITKEVPKYEVYNDPNQNQNPFGDLLPGFNINIPRYRQNGTEKKEVGGGSGFFVSSDGLIVTNRHVVSADNVEYAVYTNSGKKYDAKVIARDQVLDIALIKVTGSGFPYLKLGDSDGLEVGQT